MVACRCLAAVFVGLFLLAAEATAQIYVESEPNNTAANANGPYTPPFTFEGSIGPIGDQDVFTFTLTQTCDVRIEATLGPLFTCTPQSRPAFDLFAPDALTLLASSDVTGTSPCSIIDFGTPGAVGLAPGTYYVAVQEAGNNGVTPYIINVRIRVGAPITRTFTYQGKLMDGVTPANGNFDIIFSLWSDANTANADNYIASDTHPLVAVADGLFTETLSFGDQFKGKERYLRTAVRPSGSTDPYTVLEPPVRVSPTPYAMYAMEAAHAATADSATTATTATNATNAQNAALASVATVASSVAWNNITGKPAGFADDTDNTARWLENGVSITYMPTGRFVGIGTDTPGAFALAVQTTAAKAGGGSWSVFCDERLKHDIAPLTGTLDRLLQLHGYSFEYNPDAIKNRLALPGTQIGLLAGEVEKVFPEWVGQDAEGYRYVTERATTALMVEALRDLRTEKDRELNALKAENAELKARLERLEKALLAKP